MIHHTASMALGLRAAVSCILGVSTLSTGALAAVDNLSSPFVYATAGFTSNGTDKVDEKSNSAGPVVTNIFGGAAAARANFGSGGYKYPSATGEDAYWGFSMWSDGFKILGSPGNGTLTFSVSIYGNASGQWDQGYSLFVSDNPFSLQATIAEMYAVTANCLPDTSCGYDFQLTGATRVTSRLVNNGDQPANVVLSGFLPFTYGATFYLLGTFGGDGSTPANFYNSATLGITAPGGSSLQNLSNSVYASAVPEPSTLFFAIAGVILVATKRYSTLRCGEA